MSTKTTKQLLETLIREQLKIVLSEQELDDVASDISADLDLGVDELDTPDDPTEAPDDALGGDDAGAAEDGLGGEGDDGAGLDDGGDMDGGGMDFGGGGMGGGGFGGGGGMDDLGGGGDAGGEGDDSEEEDDASAVPEPPETPEAGVMEDVKAAMDETTNPQILLNIAKASVQKYFDSFEQATSLIQMFQQEQDPTLQDVGRRLSAFLKGF